MFKLLSGISVYNVFAPPLTRCTSGRPYPGFIYYPRYPDQQDPPITPSKVFMVELLKGFKHQPWWDRRLLVQLGLNHREYGKYRRVILKNTPEINAMLWRVKHLIKITPVTFPNGEPTEEDIGSTRLDSAGRMSISSRHKPDPLELKAEEEYWNDVKRLDKRTKAKHSLFKWNKGYDLD